MGSQFSMGTADAQQSDFFLGIFLVVEGVRKEVVPQSLRLVHDDGREVPRLVAQQLIQMRCHSSQLAPQLFPLFISPPPSLGKASLFACPQAFLISRPIRLPVRRSARSFLSSGECLPGEIGIILHRHCGSPDGR